MAGNHERRRSNPTNSDWIGEDLLVEIMKRLPVEALGRSRCVCKLWNSLISSPFFINLQHRCAYSTTPPNLKPYLRLNSEWETSFGQLALCRSPQQTPIIRQLQFPFRFLDDPPTDSFRFTDSVNGVICLSYSMGSGLDSTILWNPAIRKYVLLPRLPCPVDPDDSVDNIRWLRFFCNAIGFGYNKSSVNEFKVVRIWLPYKASLVKLSPTCEVYSTLEGAWRSLSSTLNDALQSCHYEAAIMSSRRSCFVNGSIHWLISGRYTVPNYLVLMFDCEQEKFTTMDLPREIIKNIKGGTEPIIEFGGKLAAVYLSDIELSTKEWMIEMWVMQEHGVVSSWEKLHRVGDTFTSHGLVVSRYLPALRKEDRDSVEHYQTMKDHVHEESLFLLDHHNARSYTHDEMVNILVPLEFNRESINIHYYLMQCARETQS